MARTIFSLMIALFALAATGPTFGPAAASASTEAVVAADPQETPPQTPEAVSPADPSIKPPLPGGWCCPRCGAECTARGPRFKGRQGGPMLAPGRHEHERARGQRGQRMGREGRGMNGRGMMGMGAGRGVAADRLLRNASELELTEEQIGKLQNLAYETKKKMIDLRADIETERLEMHKLMQSDGADLTQIKRHLAAISKARLAMQEARIENLFEARKLLTDEQKKMVKEKHPRLGMIID